MRFGELVGADALRGVLGGKDDKGLRQRIGLVVDGDTAFGHRFKQRGLGPWRGAVELVGKEHLGEDGTGMKDEGLLVVVVDLYPKYVCG